VERAEAAMLEILMMKVTLRMIRMEVKEKDAQRMMLMVEISNANSAIRHI